MTLTSIFLLVLGAGIPTLGESLSPISLTTVEVVPQGWGDAGSIGHDHHEGYHNHGEEDPPFLACICLLVGHAVK